jgi:hypothetical protein
VRVWDGHTGRQLGAPLLGHTYDVISVAFSPKGQSLASGSVDNTVRLWDMRTGKPLCGPMKGHTNTVLCVTFSPDGERLASAGWDHTVRLWDARTGQSVGPPLKGGDGITALLFTQDGKQLWSREFGDETKLWDIARYKEINVAERPPPFAKHDYALHRSDSHLALRRGASILLVDLTTPDATELGTRASFASFDRRWHDQLATKLETAQEWFAAAIHRALLARNEPGNLTNWQQLMNDRSMVGALSRSGQGR